MLKNGSPFSGIWSLDMGSHLFYQPVETGMSHVESEANYVPVLHHIVPSF